MATGADVVRVREALDIAAVDRVHEVLTSALAATAAGSGPVRVDMTDCGFVGVVGYRMLCDCVRTAAVHDVDLQLVGARPCVVRAIAVMDRVFAGALRSRVLEEPEQVADLETA